MLLFVYLHTSDKDKKSYFYKEENEHMKIYVRQDKYNNNHNETKKRKIASNLSATYSTIK